MCEFQPGDMAVCIEKTGGGALDGHAPCKPGEVFTVTAILIDAEGEWLEVSGRSWDAMFNAARFRKVPRINLDAWLEQASGDTDALDRRVCA